MADIDIINMGLGRLGIGYMVKSITPPDDNQIAGTAAFWYPQARNQLLRRGAWSWCRKGVALALIDATGTYYPGYQYIYEYPSDCQSLKAVTTSAGNRNTTYAGNWWWNSQAAVGGPARIPYEVISLADGSGKAIATDISNAYALYFFYQTLTDTYDDLFIDALAWRFGAEAGGPLKASPQLVQQARKYAQEAYMEALAQALNEEQQDYEKDSVSILIRQGGYGW